MPVKLATSIKELDLSGLKLPVIAIYDHPKDYPEYYVARVFDTDRPTDTIILKDTLAAVQEDIRDNTNMIFFNRGADDDKCIVGAWM
ncbi:MAG: hypothetical protein IJ439_03695 [Tyzzerella sp.]|nr:hypothetical protein [Tyzzerella sp.]